MNLNKIHKLFAEKIENTIKEQFVRAFDLKLTSEELSTWKVLISFKNSRDRDAFISNHDKLKFSKKFDLIPSMALELKKEEIQQLTNEELVKRIEEDQKLYLSMIEVIEMIGLKEYRRSNANYTGQNVKIGLIDEGINKELENVKENILMKFSLHDEANKVGTSGNNPKLNHAALMANIICNKYLDENNNLIGIAPGVKIIDFDIYNPENTYYMSDVLEMLDLIFKKNIILDILFIPLNTLDCSDGSDLLSLACNEIAKKGIIIIAPAGNFGPESCTIGSPASAKSIISIGALTKQNTIAYYSGRGPTLDNRNKPDFCLPGSKIKIPITRNLTIDFSGTSAAAAIGVGLVALMKEINPMISYKEILYYFDKNSIYLNYDINSQGFGAINAKKLFLQLAPTKVTQSIIPYNYLVKKSLKISIEIIIVLLIFYYMIHFLGLIITIFNSL
ncbi:MAG: hypothetical protein EU539_11705 [Promethearchaeota archaeon]|nr:MAG: hypothetical protein EU539_11705 [Candidatus Lokiarchaeota archaeon]